MKAVERIPNNDEVSREIEQTSSQENGGEDSSEEPEKSRKNKKGKEKAKEVNSARVTYTLEELLKLREIPQSKLWPSVFAEQYVRDGFWDPELWHQSVESAKRCASPVEDIRRQVIKEDGIVLSPQRQSFGQGCHAPHSAPERGSQQDRIKSMMGRSVDRERDGRSRLTGRVGRGRSTEYSERIPLRDRNKDPNESKRPGNREHRERPSRERFDRGDYQDRPKRSREEDPSSRSNRRQSKTYAQEDEPEWFAHGPTSQFDTIELKGFDQDEKKKKTGPSKKPVNGEVDLPDDRTTSNSPSMLENDSKSKTDSPHHDGASEDENDMDNDSKGFDINQFFMSETILPFSGGVEQVSSRFSQFFGSGSRSVSRSNSRTGSRRSSLADEFIELSGYSSPRPVSPAQDFMFTPITSPPPSDLDANPEILAEILQKTKINVKPLLDTVLSSGKEPANVKGELHLEEIEADIETKRVVDKKNKENLEHMKGSEDLTAFNILVETMKTTGNLPYKPSSTISAHLQPRPVSPKRRTPHRTPSPSLKNYQRGLSPVELMQQVALQANLLAQRPPSPAQVVPQMERPLSPYGMLQKSIATPTQDLFASQVLRRSPSPLSMMYAQRRSAPLLGPDAFTTAAQYSPHRTASPPPVIVRPTPLSAKTPGRSPGMQQRRYDGRTGRHYEQVTPKTAPVQSTKSSQSLTSMAFMPTSVMKNLHNQKTPKVGSCEETKEPKDSVAVSQMDDHLLSQQKDTLTDESEQPDDVLESETTPKRVSQSADVVNGPSEKCQENERKNQMSPISQLRQQLARHESSGSMDETIHQDQRLNTKPVELKKGASLSPPQNQQNQTERKLSPHLLQQPSAFRSSLSPRSNFSVRPDGSHSEPQTPYHSISSSSVKEPARVQPHSAPSTPQRHPLAGSSALSLNHSVVNDPRVSLAHETWLKETKNFHRMNVPRPDIKDQVPIAHAATSHVPNGPSHQENRQTLSSHPSQRQNSIEGRFEHPRQHLDSFRRPPPPVSDMKQNLTPQEMNQYRMRQHNLMHQQNAAFSGGRASPSMARPPMQGLPPRGAFMPSYGHLSMNSQGTVHPGLVSAGMSPAYLARYGMVSPGIATQGSVAPNQHAMPMSHPSARYPMLPHGQPPYLYGQRTSPNYHQMSPTTMMFQQAQQAQSMRMAPQFMQGGRASPSILPQHRDPSPQPLHEQADTNPLTKWFSADVLKQATPRAPSVHEARRKMLSVEELERQQAAVPN